MSWWWRATAARPVDDLHAPPHQPVGDLDVLPGGVRKGRVEESLLEEERAGQRDVGRVEEVEGHRLRVLDQRVAELQPVLVDVVEKRGRRAGRAARSCNRGRRPDAPASPPAPRRARRGAAAREPCRRPERGCTAPAPRARRGSARRRAPRFAARSRGTDGPAGRRAGGPPSRRGIRRRPPRPRRAGASPVVRAHRAPGRASRAARTWGRRPRRAARSPEDLPRLDRTRRGARPSSSRNYAPSKRSSPGYVGTIRRGNRAKISASARRRFSCTARRFSASESWCA